MPNEQTTGQDVAPVETDSTEFEQAETSQDTEVTDETSESQETDESPEPESSEEPAEDEDDGWSSWAKEKGLPEGIKDPDSFAESYKSMLQEMKRFQTQSSQKPEEHAPHEAPKEAPKSSYFSDSPVTALVDQWDAQGLFQGNTELKQQYAGLAKMFDTAVGPELKKAEMVMTTLARNMAAMQERLFGMEWNTVDGNIRSKVKRTDVDELMQKHNFPNYEAAVRFYITTQRPDLLSTVFNQGKSEGEREAQKKKKFRWSSARGNSGQAHARPDDFTKYLDGEGRVDQAKLNRLPPKQRSRVLDDIIKAGQKAGLTV